MCTLSDLNHTDSARSCWITVFSGCKMKECYFTFSPGLLSSQKPSASMHDIFPSVECWSVCDICYIPSWNIDFVDLMSLSSLLLLCFVCYAKVGQGVVAGSRSPIQILPAPHCVLGVGSNDFSVSFVYFAWYFDTFVNSYSASHDNWCTETLWNRVITAQCEGMGK